MDNFPADEQEIDLDYLALSHSFTSTFEALHTVNPPSPILTPSQVEFSWSSGDIPVLLYDEAYAQLEAVSYSDISNLSLPHTHGREVSKSSKRDSSGSAISLRGSAHIGVDATTSGLRSSVENRTSGGISKSSRSSRAESTLCELDSLDSFNTITSVGTFGPKPKRSHWISDELQAPEVDCLPQVSSPPKTDLGAIQDIGVSIKEVVSRSGRSHRSSIQRLSGIFACPSILANGERFPQATERNCMTPTPGTFDLEGPCQSINSPTYEVELGSESLLTPKKTSIPKTVSWISSRDWDSQKYKEYVAQEDTTRILPQSDIDNEAVIPPRRSPIRPRVLEHRDMNVIVETPRASKFAQAIHEYRKPTLAEDNTHFDVPQPFKQDDHAWLKDVTIQFLIDQEGFRAAQPCYKFTGVARLRSSQSSRAPGTVMAQFRPVTRQAFHFHYAPFETPPILRRVTVDFDDTHDYLSKQAHLTLKSNGVYVLHGHEILSAGESEPTKLYWQFEYLVDDRRVDGLGRVMEGEKILTPLTFSCTPALVLPQQGKRNNIMHVFKKGVASKLVAEKLQPPGAVPVGNKATGFVGTVSTSPEDAHFFSKGHAWNLHKRGQSHGVRRTDVLGASNIRPYHHTVAHRSRRSPGTDNISSENYHGRQRRASSAGEDHRASDAPRFSTLISSGHRHDVAAVNLSASITPTRHIVAPAKLAQLLDTPSSPKELNVHFSMAQRNSSAFIPLTPRPRQGTHVTDPSRTQ